MKESWLNFQHDNKCLLYQKRSLEKSMEKSGLHLKRMYEPIYHKQAAPSSADLVWFIVVVADGAAPLSPTHRPPKTIATQWDVQQLLENNFQTPPQEPSPLAPQEHHQRPSTSSYIPGTPGATPSRHRKGALQLWETPSAETRRPAPENLCLQSLQSVEEVHVPLPQEMCPQQVNVASQKWQKTIPIC